MARIGALKGILKGKYSYGRLEAQNTKGMKIYKTVRKGSVIRTGINKEKKIIAEITHRVNDNYHTSTIYKAPRINGRQKFISSDTIQTEPKNNLYKTIINYSGTFDKTSKRHVELKFQKGWAIINGKHKRNDTLLNAKVITTDGDVYEAYKSFKDVSVSDFVKYNRSNIVLVKNGEKYDVVPYNKINIRKFFNQFMKGQA